MKGMNSIACAPTTKKGSKMPVSKKVSGKK